MIKKGQVLENIRIEKVAAEGKCLARVDNQVIFTSGLAPGDLVDIRIIRKRKSYLEGRAIKIHEYSDQRVEPFCAHFGMCGGCKWQHLNYKAQLQYKQQQVEEQLTRIGNLEIPEVNQIIGSETDRYYRNKLEFTFSTNKWFTKEEIESGSEIDKRGLGFHLPGRYDKILDLDHCYLQVDPSNKIRDFVREKAIALEIPFYDIRTFSGNLRNLILRTSTTGDLMVILQLVHFDDKCSQLLEDLKEQFPEISSLNYIENRKKNDTYSDLPVHNFLGEDFIKEKMLDLTFKISPKSFFQTNTPQAVRLYQETLRMAGINNEDIVYDLYCGAGTISLFLARQAKKVVGLEYVEDAVKDAEENARLNGIRNASFYAGDMKDILVDEFISEHGKPNVIVADPPRAGMHEDVIKTIIETKVPKIVYVSCNPATQARDLGFMNDHYRVTEIQPVDMFPHTQHVENICLLEIKP